MQFAFITKKAIRRDRLKSNILSYLTVKKQDPDLSRSVLNYYVSEQGRDEGHLIGGVGGCSI